MKISIIALVLFLTASGTNAAFADTKEHGEPQSKLLPQAKITEAQARAFMLLHIFMHELGHHYDRIHQKHTDSSKGEDYAERFANVRFEQLFPEYVRAFGHPSRAI